MFKVGDRVKCTRLYGTAAGKVGTVVHVTVHVVGIRFDKLTSGHGCNGFCEIGKGWYLMRDSLEKASEFKGNK